MNEPSPQQTHYDDEISLVDLAKILIKRWKSMAVIFIVVVLVALVYALLMPRTYNYTSLYGVAEQGPNNALEDPAALVARAQSLYIGPETRELAVGMELERLPFDTEIVNPDNTLLVSLTSEASEVDAEAVATLHGSVLIRLKEGQQASVERYRHSLERQLENARATLDAAKQSGSLGAAEVVAGIMGRIAALEASLVELREGEISQTAVQSLEPTGTSRTLILALGIVLGGMLAVLGAFFMQFAGLVRKSLKEDT